MGAVNRVPGRRGRATVLLAIALGAAVATAQPVAASTPGIYSVPYSSQLYLHAHTALGPVTTNLELADWVGRGAPEPTLIVTEYVHYSWSPHIYAVSYFDDNWLWSRVSTSEWAQVGFPEPRIAVHIAGTDYVTFGGSTPIFAVLDGVAHQLTREEWAMSGYRPPRTTDFELFKLSWTSDIAAGKVIIRNGSRGVEQTLVAYDEWQAAGFPQPWVLPMLPGDRVCAIAGSDDLHYSGSTFEGVLTFEQWQSTGFAVPDPACVIEPSSDSLAGAS